MKPLKQGYAPYWSVLSAVVRFAIDRAMCRHCGALHGQPHPDHGGTVWLATAHLNDKAPLADRLDNLAALCQWCHLAHDAPHRAHKPYKRKVRPRRQKPGKPPSKASLEREARAKAKRARAERLAVHEAAKARAEAFARFMSRATEEG